MRGNLFWRANGDDAERIGEILDTIGLAAHRQRLAGSLSHGQKQWLEIGMLIAQDPKLLLVDEPVAGMTDAETMTTAELLKDIAKDHTVIVVEHDMEFVRRLGVKVTVLHEGSVLAEGTHRRGERQRARGGGVSGAVGPGMRRPRRCRGPGARHVTDFASWARLSGAGCGDGRDDRCQGEVLTR